LLVGDATYWSHIATLETTTSTKYDTLAGRSVGHPGQLLQPGQEHRLRARSVDVSRYLGQTVTLTLTGREDSSLATTSCSTTSRWAPAPARRRPPTRPDADQPGVHGDLTSNTAGDTWTGHQSVTFTNASPTALTEVYLRLWDNYHGSCPTTPTPSATSPAAPRRR